MSSMLLWHLLDLSMNNNFPPSGVAVFDGTYALPFAKSSGPHSVLVSLGKACRSYLLETTPLPSLCFSSEILPPCLISLCEFPAWFRVFLLLSKSVTTSVLSPLVCVFTSDTRWLRFHVLSWI